MPELAEVALFARDLNRVARSRKVLGVSFPNQQDWGKTIVPPRIQRDLKALVGQRLSFFSEGKALLLKQMGAPQPMVEFRLGMTGQFHIEPLTGKWKRHCFLELRLEDFIIRYADPRRFGRVTAPREKNHSLGGYSRTKGFWHSASPTPPKGYLTRPRISWLLGTGDQTGVGNYMANEALGKWALSPFEPCSNEAEAIRVLRKCGEIAKRSFTAGGNSFGSGFYSVKGIEGGFAEFCNFYQNPKVPRITFQGRPLFTYFKPKWISISTLIPISLGGATQ